MHRRHLPIANPCEADWNSMTVEGARRFCDQCDKHVHDLSAMTQQEAEGALERGRTSSSGMCVRYRVTPDGSIRFKQPTAPAPVRWGLAAAAGLTATLLAGCTTQPEPTSINAQSCTYDRGAWSFTLARGEGNCPPVDMIGVETTEPHVMGEMPIPDPVEPDSVPEMGDVIEAPPPDLIVKGDVGPAPQIIEEPPPTMGKVAHVPDPEPTEVLMGDIAAPGDEPCDPVPTGDVDQGQIPVEALGNIAPVVD